MLGMTHTSRIDARLNIATANVVSHTLNWSLSRFLAVLISWSHNVMLVRAHDSACVRVACVGVFDIISEEILFII
jgi:hypothetical protein